MRKEAANAFLKTLEEPPAGTFLFLLTTRPYSILPTIRSRTIVVRLEEIPPIRETKALLVCWINTLTRSTSS